MQKRNYSKELTALLQTIQGTPRLLLHACCAPCSSYVLEYLSDYFAIDVFFYNPNIAPEEEFEKRRDELERLIAQMPAKNPVRLLPSSYDGQRFQGVAFGLESAPEGGARCARCFRLRLEETAKLAADGKYDYFTTTLSISPLKNAQLLNQIGEELAERYHVKHLPADFKKQNGYKRSIELSREYQLYRQDYCGCIYSKAEREMKKSEGAEVCQSPEME